jgi:hypothetical protein
VSISQSLGCLSTDEVLIAIDGVIESAQGLLGGGINHISCPLSTIFLHSYGTFAELLSICVCPL